MSLLLAFQAAPPAPSLIIRTLIGVGLSILLVLVF